MQISGKISSVELSPYEAFIEFTDSNVSDVFSITVQSHIEAPLEGLSINQLFELDCILWLGIIKSVSQTPKATHMSQPDRQNGTIGCGKVMTIIDRDTFIIEINGGSIRLETELDYTVTKGSFVNFTAELHSEI